MFLLKHILSWSGGKDSTASIILAHLNNEPLDVIVFCEVMYDKKRNISGENPKHIDFIWNKAKPIFESWGYEVVILRAERDYLDCFNRVIKYPRKKMENKGKKHGFIMRKMCDVKRDCKLKPMKDFYKSLLNEEIIEYVGICIDEPKRLKSLYESPNKISLLEKYGYTEEMAMELCKEYDLLSPCYELSKRGGCWMCPNAKLAEHRDIRNLYPDIWREFVNLENEPDLVYYKFDVFGKTLHEIDTILSTENT